MVIILKKQNNTKVSVRVERGPAVVLLTTKLQLGEPTVSVRLLGNPIPKYWIPK